MNGSKEHTWSREKIIAEIDDLREIKQDYIKKRDFAMTNIEICNDDIVRLKKILEARE